MKRADFNISIQNIKRGGKHYVDEYLQYCGFYFLNLTDKQTETLYDLLLTMGYPLVEENNKKWILLPNGLRFTKYF